MFQFLISNSNASSLRMPGIAPTTFLETQRPQRCINDTALNIASEAIHILRVDAGTLFRGPQTNIKETLAKITRRL